MGEGYWSYGCRNDVEWWGVSGIGCWYRSRHGTYSVTGGLYQKYAQLGFECYVNPFLGAPVKPEGWIQEMNYGRGAQGQWFENGAIGWHDGRWNVMYGRYGQSSLRRALRHPIRTLRPGPRSDAELPPDPPVPLPVPPEEAS